MNKQFPQERFLLIHNSHEAKKKTKNCNEIGNINRKCDPIDNSIVIKYFYSSTKISGILTFKLKIKNNYRIVYEWLHSRLKKIKKISS